MPRFAARLERSDPLASTSLSLLAATVAGAGLGFFFWIVAARMSDPGSVGTANAIVSFALIVSLLATLGLGHALIGHLAPDTPDDEWIAFVNLGTRISMATALATGALVAVVAPAFSSSFGWLGTPAGIAVFAIASAAWAGGLVLDLVYVAASRAGFVLARAVIVGTTKLALAPLFLTRMAPSTAIVSAWAVAAVVGIAIALIAMTPRIRPGARWWTPTRATRASWGPLTRASALHHASVLGAQAPALALPAIVLTRSSPAEAGYFSVAWMLAGACLFVSPAVGTALFAGGAHDREGLRRLFRRSARLIAVLTAAPFVVLVLLGRPILGIFGPAYASAGWATLVVLLVAVVPDAVTNLAVAVWRAQSRLRPAAVLNVVLAVVTVTVAWWAVPHHGAVAAAAAWGLAQLCGTVVVVTSRLR